MSGIFKKLNLKDQAEILVLNAPDSFAPALASLENVVVRRDSAEIESILFSLAFVTKQHEVDSIAQAVAAKAPGDAVVWFAYPKSSSKRYTCEFNRDTGWAVLGAAGFEPVRQVAIDEDWSALRFRRVEFIRNLTRNQNMALSAQGKERLKKQSEE